MAPFLVEIPRPLFFISALTRVFTFEIGSTKVFLAIKGRTQLACPEVRFVGLRAGLIAVGLLLLASDIGQDWLFFTSTTVPGKTPLLLAAILRNLLMVVAIVLAARGGRWAPAVLAVTALVGLGRRAAFLLPWLSSANSEQILLVHSGADIIFRILLLALAYDFFRQPSKP